MDTTSKAIQKGWVLLSEPPELCGEEESDDQWCWYMFVMRFGNICKATSTVLKMYKSVRWTVGTSAPK